MGAGLVESLANRKDDKGGEFSIAPGIVKDNLNVLSEGMVQVHIPALPDFDPWARVIGIGGGSGRGFVWIPEVDDEVLVAFSKNDDRDAYVIGGLWSTSNRPPATGPIDMITKRVIKTGKKNSPLGHEIELDDAAQSVRITTSLSQEILLDKSKIAITTSQGLMKITMDLLATPPAIQIESTTGDIKLSAPLGTISLDGLKVEINGDLSTDIKSTGQLNVQGTLVKIN
jgi:phage baseplate assembly protein gpV